MSTLGLLISGDEELVAHVSGRECDSVVDVSELFRGEVKEDLDAWQGVIVVADSITSIRTLLPQLAAMSCVTKEVEVVVGGHPISTMLGVPASPVGNHRVIAAQKRRFDRPVPHVRLTVRFGGRPRLADVLASMLQSGPSVATRPAGGLRVGIVDAAPDSMLWASGDPAAIRLSPECAVGDDPLRPVDIVVSGGAGPLADATPVVIDAGGPERRPRWSELVTAPRESLERFVSTASGALVPPVDTDTLTPIGFRTAPDDSEVWLRRVEDGALPRLAFADPTGARSSSFHEWSGLTERVVDEVRPHRVVHDDPYAHSGPVQQAAFLVQAACAALPVVADDLSTTVRRLIGRDLAEAFATGSAADLTDRVRREAYCMAIRRTAFERHGARRRWSSIARDNGFWSAPAAAVSVVVATRRPELVPRICEQVARQDWPRVELVLGLHGVPRDDPRVDEIEATFPGPLVVAEVPADRSFGEMLNDLCSMASGELLAKMDDDDWYSSHHVTDLVHAAEYSRADLVGSGAEFMYLEALDLTVRRHQTHGHRYANRVPGASLLLSAGTLRSAGGWRPIPRGVDTALAQAIIDSGGSIYRSHGLGIMVYRAAEGHTWDPGVEYFVRGDIDQWPGFVPPPDIIGPGPDQRSVPVSWFDRTGAGP